MILSSARSLQYNYMESNERSTHLIVVVMEGDPVGVAEVAQVGGQVAHAQLQPPLARRPFCEQLRHWRVLVDPSDLEIKK